MKSPILNLTFCSNKISTCFLQHLREQIAIIFASYSQCLRQKIIIIYDCNICNFGDYDNFPDRNTKIRTKIMFSFSISFFKLLQLRYSNRIRILLSNQMNYSKIVYIYV